ncbi:MAG: hypothetical protein JWL66_2971 [Sphingomonadales bacterium]|nr:hypothetical protein [Sphingomonadales bacterium]
MSASGLLYGQSEDSLSVWATRDLRARLVLDDKLIITWQNPAASRFFDEVSGGFAISSQRIRFEDSDLSHYFGRFVRSSKAQISTLCMPSKSGDYILCTAIFLRNSGSSRETGITLRRASETCSMGAANLQAAFGFTPSERQVVERLFAGQTAEQTGNRMQLSVGTVRAHIRHIYEKLDVSSREGLFNKLMPFMLLT